MLVFRAPQITYRFYKKGGYKSVDQLTRKDKAQLHFLSYLRLGAYGDPLSAPWSVTQEIIKIIQPKVITGYTHLWSSLASVVGDAPKQYLQASCDSLFDEVQAADAGWGTYLATHTVAKANPTQLKTVICPAQASEGEVQCNTCGKCAGASKGLLHIRAYEHGMRSEVKARKLMNV